MRRALLGLALILSGCSDTVVPVRLVRIGDEPGDREMVDEAMAILGLEREGTTRQYGSLELILIGPVGGVSGGLEIQNRPCVKKAVSSRRVEIIAHELGHLLGLEHTCDPCEGEEHDNLMASHVFNGSDVTDEQLDTVARSAWRLSGCR